MMSLGLFENHGPFVSFVVLGNPVGKGRPRITTRGGFARAFTPDKTRDYERHVSESAQCAMLDKGQKPTAAPVRVVIHANFSVPVSYSKKKRLQCAQGIIKPTVKPDIDNIIKAVLDGMNGVVFDDDKQVFECTARKSYTEKEGFVLVEVFEEF